MDYIIARNRVKELFSEYNDNKTSTVYESLSENEVRQIYYALHDKLPGHDKLINLAFIYFIIYASRRYDRFNPLRPIDTDDLFLKYKTMHSCLKKMEPIAHVYSWYMDLNIIRWEVYRKCANKSFSDELNDYINDKIRTINAIKVNGINQQCAMDIDIVRRKALELLNSFKSGIVTIVKTSLPYKLTQKNSTFHLYISGIEVDVVIENTIKSSPIHFAQFSQDTTLDEMGLSRNSYSQSVLTMTFHCFIDTGINLDSVSFSNKDKFSWNYLFDFTYKAIKSIWNYLQTLGDEYVTWPPLPQDIGSIEWSIMSGETNIDSGYFTNPATGFHISSNNRGILHYDIKDESPLLWSDNAYYYARLYAKSGQTEETIFWINVAVEALIDEFLMFVSPDSKTYEDFTNQENKFQSSEEILSEQFPEMAGRVLWPNTTIHASVYTKLKRVLEYLNQDKKKISMIIGCYSSISRKRNKLFHGSPQDLKTEDISKAFDSFNQLKTFFSDYRSMS